MYKYCYYVSIITEEENGDLKVDGRIARIENEIEYITDLNYLHELISKELPYAKKYTILNWKKLKGHCRPE